MVEILIAVDASKTDAARTTDGTQEAYTLPRIETQKTNHAEDPMVSGVSGEVMTKTLTSRTTAQTNTNV